MQCATRPHAIDQFDGPCSRRIHDGRCTPDNNHLITSGKKPFSVCGKRNASPRQWQQHPFDRLVIASSIGAGCGKIASGPDSRPLTSHTPLSLLSTLLLTGTLSNWALILRAPFGDEYDMKWSRLQSEYAGRRRGRMPRATTGAIASRHTDYDGSSLAHLRQSIGLCDSTRPRGWCCDRMREVLLHSCMHQQTFAKCKLQINQSGSSTGA